MATLIEMLARKKRSATPARAEGTVVLPVMTKEHEGSCGPGCGCGDGEGGCCGD